jgi:putative aldouronate transport system substrate-binding protein
MKGKKKWVSLACVSVLMASSLAGCTEKTEETVKKDDPGTVNATASSSKPVSVSLFQTDNSLPFPTGDVMSKHPWFKLLGEKTNTSLELTTLPHAQYVDQLRLRLASGAKPDAIQEWGLANIEDVLGELPIPLNDLIDKYGPNLKKVIPQSAWDFVTREGKIYAIPVINYVGNVGSERLLFVRKDYLDKVGITELPKTTDDFLNMLRAFRDKDPVGGGTIPFSMRENITWGESIFGMFGFDPRYFSFINGQYIPNIVHPKMKDAIAFFKTMYDEKLIDSEFLTLKGTNWNQKITSGKVAVWNHQAQTNFQALIEQANPGTNPKVVVIPTPKAPGVTEAGNTNLPVGGIYVITKHAKNPEAFVKILDWLASNEGQVATYLGLEGDTYTKEGNTYKYDKAKDQAQSDVKWRISYRVAMNDAIASVYYGPEAQQRLKTQGDIASKEGFKAFTMPLLPSMKSHPELQFSGAMFQETFAKIILGKESIEAYDRFVETWKKQGGDEIIKEATDWYNKNMK